MYMYISELEKEAQFLIIDLQKVGGFKVKLKQKDAYR